MGKSLRGSSNHQKHVFIINIGLILFRTQKEIFFLIQKSIESLPTIIVDLKHLIVLLLQGCQNPKEVLLAIGNISSLSSILSLSYCKSIESLPTIIVDLKHLTKLKLGRCKNLKELHQTIGSISSLSMWNLSNYKSIESL